MKSHLKDLIARRVQALAHQWKYRRLATVEVEIEDVRVTFNTSDAYSKRWWFPRYLDGRIHEPAVTHLIVHLAKQARWFADVGANIGWYTCIVGSLLRSGQVDAFEMKPALCKILERNVRLNHLNVRVHNLAITGDAREVSFSLDQFMGTYLPDAGSHAAGRTRRVKGKTLDELCEDNQGSGLIKIDVEGAEMDVLSGMGNLLKRPDLDLLIELHPWPLEDFGSSVGRVLEVLRDHGYVVRELKGFRRQSADLEIVEPSEIDENNMIWATRSEPRARSGATTPRPCARWC